MITAFSHQFLRQRNISDYLLHIKSMLMQDSVKSNCSTRQCRLAKSEIDFIFAFTPFLEGLL